MKNVLIIALALFTVSAFAGTNASKKANKAARKEAKAACTSEGKTKKEMKSCIKAKLNNTTTTTTTTTTSETSEVAPESEMPAM